MQIKKILVPVDFSRASRAALFDAMALAQRMRPVAQVEALHIAADDEALCSAQMLAACFLRGCDSPEVAMQVRASAAPLAQTIAGAGREGGFDLIVMGTADEGRTASAVIREAGVPVLTTRLDESDALGAML